MKRCPSGKKKHATRRSAELHAFRLTADNLVRHVYRCPDCRAWHVTRKQPKAA